MICLMLGARTKPNPNQAAELTDAGSAVVVARSGARWVGRMGEGVRRYSFQLNGESWDATCRLRLWLVVLSHVWAAERVDLQSSRYKERSYDSLR